MMDPFMEIYTIVETGADADKGFFPDPIIHGSYVFKKQATQAMEALIAAEKENLDERYDHEERDESHWEMYMDGYAAGCFSRIEILTSTLCLPVVEQSEMHCDTCLYSYFALEAIGRTQFFLKPIIRQHCDNLDYNSPKYTHKMLVEDRAASHCRFWTQRK